MATKNFWGAYPHRTSVPGNSVAANLYSGIGGKGEYVATYRGGFVLWC
jgi:hypothetical protein